MLFQDVCLSAMGVTLPNEVWSSDDLERMLAPVYSRLRLPEGRLELMTGIRQRRVWDEGTNPSGPSITSGKAAIDASPVERQQIGCLIHASVCRDFLEPATASRVHDGLSLPADCWVYDVSNACLGLLNGMVQIASMIQAGMIRAGIVVGTENSRPLLQQTIHHLNTDTNLTRRSVKPAFASLTIGSGSCAMLLCHRDLHEDATRVRTAIAQAHTQHHDLCVSGTDTAGAEMTPLMDTDSEKLMEEGVATGVAASKRFFEQSGWQPDAIGRSICHQVGQRHRETQMNAMGLPMNRDTVTFPILGNTGSVALPLTLAAAAVRGDLQCDDTVGLFGIGSGINSAMVGCHWGDCHVAGNAGELIDTAHQN